ncbi:MAG: PilT/PilU family type 4a pilus ATPase [Schwartzia sp.]|nr:PilT/PilU family type 4a pilus ATPase [Schwartzia sp. (in: firmicutes)]
MASRDRDFFDGIFNRAIEMGASDVHIATDSPVFIRVDGRLFNLSDERLNESDVKSLLDMWLSEEEWNFFNSAHEMDFAQNFGKSRFRVNLYRSHTGMAVAVRIIPSEIPALGELGLPEGVAALCEKEHGLVLVTGKTGAGKSTTMAAMIKEINDNRRAHIISMEDPIEYVHVSNKCLVSQREYGSDFTSFPDALRAALREDPDVIVVGEMRDAETVAAALNAAETGHLVIASLHTKTAAESVMRVESFFEAGRQPQIRAQLAIVLEAVISQQLLPGKNGGRVLASEFLIATLAIRNLMRQGKAQQIDSAIMTGGAMGMQTMKKSIGELLSAGKIDTETAERYFYKESNGAS